MSTTKTVEIYADGACKGNPGPGGWGAWISYAGQEKELFGGELLTTNNRMELTAVIRALEALNRSCHAMVYTDSVYVQKGISEWIVGWKARNWRTADKKPVKNDDLLIKMAGIVQRSMSTKSGEDEGFLSDGDKEQLFMSIQQLNEQVTELPVNK